MVRTQLWRVLHRGIRKRRCPSRRAPVPQPRRRGEHSGLRTMLLTLALAFLMAWSIIGMLETKLRPMIQAIAETEAVNTLLGVVGETIAEDLLQRQVDYSDFVTIQRDDGGTITALTTNMASMNLLRSELVTNILNALNGVDISTIQIPVGALIDSELLWARGPNIRVRSMRVGMVSADFQSEFSTAGINQTLHRIYLDVRVPLTLLLAGGEVSTSMSTRLCVAETVIVGAVPDAFLNWNDPQGR